MWTLSTSLHNESTFLPLMFAFSFDLTISVQISQFSVASGMKELITPLGAWNRLKKIGMIFPPSEINLGLNTGVRYTPCAESLSLTPKQFLSAQLDLLPSLRSFVRILCKTQAENISVWLPALCGPDDISGTSLFLWRPISEAQWTRRAVRWLGYLSAARLACGVFWGSFRKRTFLQGRDPRLQSNKGQFGGEWKERSPASLASQAPFCLPSCP